jgi:hypothetical protein
MKGTLYLLLLPSWVFAQQSMMDTKAPSQANFNELKSKLTQSLQSSQTTMEKAKDCLSVVQDQAGFEDCYNRMPESMRQELRITASSSQPIIYTEDSRHRSIQILDNWLQSSQATIGCFDVATNDEQIKNCLGMDSTNTSIKFNSNTKRLTEQGGDNSTQLSKEW